MRLTARAISRSDAAYWRAMSLTRRTRPFTGSVRHAHMARRRSWMRAFSAQMCACGLVAVVVVIVVIWVVWVEFRRLAGYL